jgi:cytochrome P450
MDKQPPATSTAAQDSARGEISAQYNPFVRPQLDDPYPIYSRARHESPVFYSKVLNSWIVTRYDDILEILKDSER